MFHPERHAVLYREIPKLISNRNMYINTIIRGIR